MQNDKNSPGLLLVANWDSNVGYAWWLMESYWAAIAHSYAEQYRCYLAYPSISSLPEVVQAAPIQVEQLDFTLSGGQSFFAQLRFIVKNRVKIIYYSDQKTYSLKYVVYRLLGVKHIINHDHTPGLRTPPRGLKRLLKWLIANAPWLSADALFGASDFVARRLQQINGARASKCFSIPNGIRPKPFARNRQLLGQFDIPLESIVIVGTGRANRYKGVAFALNCLHEIITQHPELNLYYLYCGDGPDLDYFKQLAQELGVSERVRFPGNLETPGAVIAACDIAFHPSLGEVGYSLSILEYMAAGLPVVVPDNPSVCGATEAQHTGCIYREHDVASAVHSLLSLIHDPVLRGKLGDNAQQRVQARYLLSNTHAALMQAFARVLS